MKYTPSSGEKHVLDEFESGITRYFAEVAAGSDKLTAFKDGHKYSFFTTISLTARCRHDSALLDAIDCTPNIKEKMMSQKSKVSQVLELSKICSKSERGRKKHSTKPMDSSRRPANRRQSS